MTYAQIFPDADPLLVEQLEKLWLECTAAPKGPEYLIVGLKQMKELRRFWRSKRKGKSTKTEITELVRVELGIPKKSAPRANEWWGGYMCVVDKRCLRRYQRKAKRHA